MKYMKLNVLVYALQVMIAAWVWASARQTHRIRLAYFRAVIRQDIAWYDMNKPSELATRLAE